MVLLGSGPDRAPAPTGGKAPAPSGGPGLLRSLPPALPALAALGLAVWGETVLLGRLPGGSPAGYLLFLLAGLLFVRGTRGLPEPPLPPEVPEEALPLGIAPTRGALFLLGGAVLFCAATLLLRDRPAGTPLVRLLCWGASLVWFLAAARLCGPPAAPDPPLSRGEWALLALLTLGALLLRLPALGSIPPNLGMDEGVMGGLARAVRSGALREPFGTSWLSHPNLWFFLQALSLRFFGESVSGLRTLSALLGTLTVPALYLLGRSLWGRTPAALAALLLLGSDHAVHFSRLALNNVADPLGATVYLAALTGGLRTGSPLLFAVAGVTLGTVLHCYFGSRLLLVLTALLGLQALLTRPRQLLRFRGHLALLTLGFLLAWAPLLQHYRLHPETWSERFRAVSIFTCPWDALRPLMERPLGERLLFNLPNSLGAFTHVPPNVYYDQQYNSRRALLNPAAAALLSLGFALACARIRRIRGFLPLAWVLSTAVFGGLLLAEPSPPYSNARYGIALPALCLLVAWGIERLAALLDPAPGRSGRILVAAALAALLAGWDADFYFRDFVRRANYAWADASNGVGRVLAAHPDRERLYVYFFSEPMTLYGNEARVFLAPDVPGADLPRSPGSPPYLPPLPEGRRPIFFFLAGREGDLTAVRVLYPKGRVFERRRADGGRIFLAYEPEWTGRTPASRDGKGAGRGKTGAP